MNKILKIISLSLLLSGIVVGSVSAKQVSTNEIDKNNTSINNQVSSISVEKQKNNNKLPDIPSTVKPKHGEQAFINANAVRLRSQPNLNSTVLELLNKGDMVYYICPINSQFVEVYYNNIHGYVAKQYVNL